MSTENETYDSGKIVVLRGLDAVRKRPGMYIGDTDDGTGLHHMVFEVLDNAIDEAMAGYCKNIIVTLHEDGACSISDDGRGIPTDIHPEEGISAAEVIMTILHAGGKFDSNSYQHSGGLHGVGVSVVNALSDRLELTIYRNDQIHQQVYHLGVPEAPLKVIGETPKSGMTGTTVKFYPSPKIFSTVEFSYDTLCTRIRELSFLNSGVNITLKDEITERTDNFHYEGGLRAFVDFINTNKITLNDTLYLSHYNEEQRIGVEVALQWNDTYKEIINCFTNNIPQRDGGTHLAGFKSALTRSINTYIENTIISQSKSKNLKDLKIDGDDAREGLVAIISVKVPDPKFSSQTKEKLVSSEVRTAVESVVSELLTTYLEENPKIASVICDKVIAAARSREAARRARELARTNKRNTFTTNKLVHCNSRNPLECEVYLVEGDSAGGSAVKARDVQTQAILPLRGKILNVEKARFDKIIESQEIANIVAVLKCGIGSEEFNLDNLRYHKIVIMTDADVDGSHIRTLLLTFFYRQMPQLIEAGKVYIAQPPLYKLTLDRKTVYLKNDDEYSKFLIEHALDGASLEVEGIAHSGEVLRTLSEAYLKVEELIKSHNQKYSEDFMKILINYTPLTYEVLSCEQEMSNWVQNLIKLLTRSHQKSIRYIARPQYDLENGLYNYQIEEIKHGISQIIDVNTSFLNSRDYREIVNLVNQIVKVYPLGKVAYLCRGDNRKPVTCFADFVNLLLQLAVTKLKPSRYKGLGEMNWEELEETTMKVENRTLLKVEVKDAIMADQLFTTLMGDDVGPRRDFIEENALYANIDL